MTWNKMSLSNKMSKTTKKKKIYLHRNIWKEKNLLIRITNVQQKTLTKIIQIQNINKI